MYMSYVIVTCTDEPGTVRSSRSPPCHVVNYAMISPPPPAHDVISAALHSYGGGGGSSKRRSFATDVGHERRRAAATLHERMEHGGGSAGGGGGGGGYSAPGSAFSPPASVHKPDIRTLPPLHVETSGTSKTYTLGLMTTYFH